MRKIEDILIVEDSEIDTWIALRVLEFAELNKNVICTGDGESALSELKRYAKLYGKLPQLILVDISLPVKDGIEVIECIKKLPEYSRKDTQLILLTEGLDTKFDLPKLVQNEIRQVIFKPLNKEKILAAIHEFESSF